jgi:hypothetical protein
VQKSAEVNENRKDENRKGLPSAGRHRGRRKKKQQIPARAGRPHRNPPSFFRALSKRIDGGLVRNDTCMGGCCREGVLRKLDRVSYDTIAQKGGKFNS